MTDSPFQYSIKREKRKTIGLYVKDQIISVKAPTSVSDKNIHDFINSKSQWILKKLEEQKHEETEKPKLYNGGNILFLGEQKTLYFEPGKAAIHEHNDALIIHHHQNTNIKKLLEQWLQKEAELYITERTHDIANTMREASRIRDITYRKTRSKWGHCTSSGDIQFNWLLIMAPPDIIDYIIIHELSHLKHMNHSAQFWQRVAQFCPNFKQHRQWLKSNAHKLAL